MSIELLKEVSQISIICFFFISHFSHNKDSPHIPRFDISQVKWWLKCMLTHYLPCTVPWFVITIYKTIPGIRKKIHQSSNMKIFLFWIKKNPVLKNWFANSIKFPDFKYSSAQSINFPETINKYSCKNEFFLKLQNFPESWFNK